MITIYPNPIFSDNPNPPSVWLIDQTLIIQYPDSSDLPKGWNLTNLLSNTSIQLPDFLAYRESNSNLSIYIPYPIPFDSPDNLKFPSPINLSSDTFVLFPNQTEHHSLPPEVDYQTLSFPTPILNPNPNAFRLALISQPDLLDVYSAVNSTAFQNPPVSHAFSLFSDSLRNQPYIPQASQAALTLLASLFQFTPDQKSVLNQALNQFDLQIQIP